MKILKYILLGLAGYTKIFLEHDNKNQTLYIFLSIIQYPAIDCFYYSPSSLRGFKNYIIRQQVLEMKTLAVCVWNNNVVWKQRVTNPGPKFFTMYNNKKYREFEKVLIAAYINSIVKEEIYNFRESG